MSSIITAIHVIACLAIIVIVLLQQGKGASMGAAFGGSSQTVFGSSGATPFLSKVTTIVAVVFMLTSLSLAFLTSPHSAKTSVVGDSTQQEAPAQSGQPASGDSQKTN